MRQTVGDVLLLSQLELVETLDVPPCEAAALLRAASRSVLSAPVTVSERSARKQLQRSGAHTRKGERVIVLASVCWGSSAAVWGSSPAPADACCGPKCMAVGICC